MEDFLDIKCLTKKEKARLMEEIKRRIDEKKRQGLLTEKEIKEIEAMKLRPLPDIQDVQSVHEDFMFKREIKNNLPGEE
ncbi:MAG: hypothetical protein ACE5GI_04535 [Candidatus Aminicenantales bacterium]